MYLEKLEDGISIKQFNIEELNLLASEIRNVIIDTVNNNGGHLSPNLGTVELIIALFYVYDFPNDKIIFDVGHQSYAYKILSNRLNKIKTIRTKEGISGFPDTCESEYDAFSTGHAGTSISAGLGYCYSRDLLKKDYNVISFVGDASFFNGENLEAITSSAIKPKNFTIILNDNGMSIGKNNNGLYKLISKVTVKKRYIKFNNLISKIFKGFIGKFLKSIKRSIKRTLNLNTVSDTIGLKYVGVFDGHNIKDLIKILTDVKNSNNPTLLHVKTIKGKGYENAEKDSSKFHGVSKDLKTSKNTFSNNVSNILEKIYAKNDKIVAITAGMKDGVGLSNFASLHPNSFIDVGIMEEHAVTLASGIATSGVKPIIFMYSTFLQRSYDQILHDVCIQNLPVVFCIDRAGFVGSDGKTHQGLFDLSYLSHIPNLTILAPKDVNEFESQLNLALELNSPVAIRYPNGKTDTFSSTVDDGDLLKWEVLSQGKNNVILAVGPRMLSLAFKVKNITNLPLEIVNARTIKPLDESYLLSISNKNVITLEENVIKGGFGSQVLEFYSQNNLKTTVKVLGAQDKFVMHATVDEQFLDNNLTLENVIKYLK